MTRKPWFADAALIAATAVWGLTFVVVKDALAFADPMTFLALRFGLGGVAAALIARRAMLAPGVLRAGALLGGVLFVGYALQTWGLKTTTPSRSAFITGLTVIFVPFVSIPVLRRRPPLVSVVGVGLAAVGLYLLTGAEFSGGLPLGDLLTLGCAVAYAFHITLTERFATRLPPMALVATQLLLTAALSAASLPLVDVRLEWSVTLLWGVAITGLLASTAAIGVQTWAQARTTAVRAAIIFSLEPVLAAGYSAALGRESLGAREALGGGLIVVAVLVAEVGAMLRRRAGRVPRPVP